MVACLPRIELWAYFTVWIGSGLISLFEVYRNSRAFKKGSSDWWGHVDGSDREWKILSPYVIGTLLPSCLLHLIISKTWRAFFSGRLMFEMNLVFSTVFYVHLLGSKPLILIYMLGLSFYAISFTKSWISVWCLAGFWRQTFGRGVGGPFGFLVDSNYTDLFIFHILFAWLLLKGIIYSLDVTWGRAETPPPKGGLALIRGFVRLMAYFLYIPSLLGSPVIMYKSFYDAMKEERSKPWTGLRLEGFILSVLRYVFWWCMTEGTIRTFFFGKMSHSPTYLARASPWLLLGIGYCSGQFFMLKYVVFYGMVRPFALEDGVDTPEHPKCIARIHSYTSMWRHFDRGLYIFIRDYIYGPIIWNKSRHSIVWKTFSSLISFVFVYLYHGRSRTIFMWSLLNFIAVSIESIGKAILCSKRVKTFRDQYFSLAAQRRLLCLLYSPLLLFSFLSNFYFFMGLPSGNMIVGRLLGLSLKEKGALLLILYSWVQGSTEINAMEAFTLIHH